jgi:hypothetical protein
MIKKENYELLLTANCVTHSKKQNVIPNDLPLNRPKGISMLCIPFFSIRDYISIEKQNAISKQSSIDVLQQHIYNVVTSKENAKSSPSREFIDRKLKNKKIKF